MARTGKSGCAEWASLRAGREDRLMAYCPPELLEDLADVFADVQTWIGVIEKRPGVFYAHGQPFLHFHLLAGARRQADVKGRSAWTQLNPPVARQCHEPPSPVRELQVRYREKAKAQNLVRYRSPNHTLQRTGARDARPGR
jgi:hypothetical protein